MKGKFDDRVNSWNSDVNGPPRSYDFTPFDYFGGLTSKVSCIKTIISIIKNELFQVIDKIDPQLCQNVIDNFTSRVNICRVEITDSAVINKKIGIKAKYVFYWN